MMNTKRSIPLGAVLVITLVLAATQAAAEVRQAKQSAEADKPLSLYRLDFVVKELEDGKIINTRSYSMWVNADGEGADLSAGNQVPYPSVINGATTAAYRSVGVQLTVRLKEMEGMPLIRASARISKVVPPESGQEIKPPPPTPSAWAPIIQSTSMDAAVLVTPGKATTISSVDDPLSKRRMQLEVTATKLK